MRFWPRSEVQDFIVQAVAWSKVNPRSPLHPSSSHHTDQTSSPLFSIHDFTGTECQVPLGKEGPVYDVSWSPRGEEFVAVHGFMPAKAILFDASARPRFDFGTGPYNTVRWSPLSRFLILAGFGNLPGDVHFFDRYGAPLSSTIFLRCSLI